VSVLKTRTVFVNTFYCGNRLASPSTFMPNIKFNFLKVTWKCPSVLLKEKFLFVLFPTKTTINRDGRSLNVATITGPSFNQVVSSQELTSNYELSLYSLFITVRLYEVHCSLKELHTKLVLKHKKRLLDKMACTAYNIKYTKFLNYTGITISIHNFSIFISLASQCRG